MIMQFFRHQTGDALTITSVLGISPPDERQISARTKAVTKMKAAYGSALRCNKLMPRLRKPL